MSLPLLPYYEFCTLNRKSHRLSYVFVDGLQFELSQNSRVNPSPNLSLFDRTQSFNLHIIYTSKIRYHYGQLFFLANPINYGTPVIGLQVFLMGRCHSGYRRRPPTSASCDGCMISCRRPPISVPLPVVSSSFGSVPVMLSCGVYATSLFLRRSKTTITAMLIDKAASSTPPMIPPIAPGDRPLFPCEATDVGGVG